MNNFIDDVFIAVKQKDVLIGIGIVPNWLEPSIKLNDTEYKIETFENAFGDKIKYVLVDDENSPVLKDEKVIPKYYPAIVLYRSTYITSADYLFPNPFVYIYTGSITEFIQEHKQYDYIFFLIDEKYLSVKEFFKMINCSVKVSCNPVSLSKPKMKIVVISNGTPICFVDCIESLLIEQEVL